MERILNKRDCFEFISLMHSFNTQTKKCGLSVTSDESGMQKVFLFTLMKIVPLADRYYHQSVRFRHCNRCMSEGDLYLFASYNKQLDNWLVFIRGEKPRPKEGY